MPSARKTEPKGPAGQRGARDGQAESAEKAWAALVAFLKARGDRLTRSRKRVCDAVMARHDHFRADDLASELARGAERVSRGTVYRTLALMVEAGLVRAIRDSDVHFHYEHTLGHSFHEHMICEVCGAFIEFDAPEVLRAIDKHCSARGFDKRTHRITILGVCSDCENGPEKHKP